MSTHSPADMRKVTITSLQAQKAAGEKIAVIAAYDASFASLIEQAGVEVILVGDSLGMVLQGHDSTLPVTIDDMVYHTQCVSRGCSKPLIIGDLPFGSYNTKEQALTNATALMQAGAHMVKLEGGEWLLDSISAMHERGIPVCAHLGLTPQSVNALGGFKVQGRDSTQAKAILEDAKKVEQAGANLLVMECIPTALGKEISQALSIPVIGIGAGPGTDAQVLVLHGLLGLTGHGVRFVHNFMGGQASIPDGLKAFVDAVKSGTYPLEEHSYR